MVRTNKQERETLKCLVRGLDYLNVGIIEKKDSDYNFGIECISNWLKKNPEFFYKFYEEITGITR